MPWEWVEPTASAAGTAVVGVAGIVATFMAGRRQTTTALEVADRQAKATAQVAREERNQRRLEAAYPPLLEILSEAEEWAWQVHAFTTGDSDHEKPPAAPERVKSLSKHGSIPAVWSPQVRALAEQWARGAGIAWSAAFRLGVYWERQGQRTHPERPRYGDPSPTIRDVYERRVSQDAYLVARVEIALRAMRAADSMLREQVWLELRGERDGTVRHDDLRNQAFLDLQQRVPVDDED